MRLRGSQIIEYLGGQTQATAGGQCTSQVLICHAYITPELFRVLAQGVNHRPPHLIKELAHKNGFHFHGGLEAAGIIGGFPSGQALLLQQAQRLGQLG